MTVSAFVLSDGKVMARPSASTTFGQLRDAYVEARSSGSMEENTLYTTKLNLRHVEETLGKKFLFAGLALRNLQAHIDRRLKVSVKAQLDKRKKLPDAEQKKFKVQIVCPVTIQKEITSFKTCWQWGLQAGLV